ncbi:MAG: ArsR/SmtB family transcription factor [Gemmatimonadaceae bacterium]
MAPAKPFSIELAVTPRFDLFYALYTLTAPAPSPLDAWKERAMLRLPRDFERIAQRVAPVPLFWPLLADALQGTAGELTFDEILANLRTLPSNELKSNVLSGIFHDQRVAQALASGKKKLRHALTEDDSPAADLLEHFGLRPYDVKSPSVSAVTTLLTDPDGFREGLLVVLERFWETGFRGDWSALEPSLRADSLRMKDLQATHSFEGLARELNLPVAADEKNAELKPRTGAPIKFGSVDRCYLLPSAFNTRRWWARYERKGERVSLYFPIAGDAASANRIVKDEWRREKTNLTGISSGVNPETVFRALGDTTRYAIASILARKPTTSADLARILSVSKPTITHHVQTLRSAGLIREVPSGGATELSLDRGTLSGLSTRAMDQLFSSRGDLPLQTTRKRKN